MVNIITFPENSQLTLHDLTHPTLRYYNIFYKKLSRCSLGISTIFHWTCKIILSPTIINKLWFNDISHFTFGTNYLDDFQLLSSNVDPLPLKSFLKLAVVQQKTIWLWMYQCNEIHYLQTTSSLIFCRWTMNNKFCLVLYIYNYVFLPSTGSCSWRR